MSFPICVRRDDCECNLTECRSRNGSGTGRKSHNWRERSQVHRNCTGIASFANERTSSSSTTSPPEFRLPDANNRPQRCAVNRPYCVRLDETGWKCALGIQTERTQNTNAHRQSNLSIEQILSTLSLSLFVPYHLC